MLNYLRSEQGAVAGEYALLLALFCGAIAISALMLGDSIGAALNTSAGLFDPCNRNGNGHHYGTCGGKPDKDTGKPDKAH
jgi:Flp pilus assembly pilin Flp